MDLKKIIAEQISEVIKEMANPLDESTKEQLMHFGAWQRALQLWFHSAHHVAKGPAFSGDHALYQRIYTGVEAEVDGTIEKIVGLTNDPGLACPHCLTRKALETMERYPSPKDLSPSSIARVGLSMEKAYINFVENLFATLEVRNMLSLGLNDYLAATTNAHETNVYLLQQRVQQVLEQQPGNI